MVGDAPNILGDLDGKRDAAAPLGITTAGAPISPMPIGVTLRPAVLCPVGTSDVSRGASAPGNRPRWIPVASAAGPRGTPARPTIRRPDRNLLSQRDRPHRELHKQMTALRMLCATGFPGRVTALSGHEPRPPSLTSSALSNVNDLPLFRLLKSLGNRRQKRHQILQTITERPDHHYANGPVAESLLSLRAC